MARYSVLCAMRDAREANRLLGEMDDGERCALRVVSRGDAALVIARQTPPDILVVDAVLPYLDGPGVVERMRAALGSRMPRVIAGSTRRFADAHFSRCGAQALLSVPWDAQALRSAVLDQMEKLDAQIDWPRAQADYERAGALLAHLGMRKRLKGFHFLAWAGALAYAREDSLYAIGERIYRPIAARFATTPQNVERLIRHAVESTMDAVGAQGVYGFFGNTIDPTRGKPTNGQMIGMLAQRMRVRARCG